MIEVIKSELIFIGATGLIADKSPIKSYLPKGSSGAYHIYDMIDIDAINDNDLILLFKGLVIAEKELSWHCGSTTPAAHVYQHINSRNLDVECALADWAFQYSDNEYIPFGFIRHGEKTAYEYLHWREDFHRRIIQERFDAEARKEERLKRAEKIALQKKLSDALTRERYNEIMQMEPLKQVQTIVDDSSRNLLYYMPVINGLLQRADVPNQCWHILLEAFSVLKSTPFNKRLKKDISKRIDDE